MTLQSKTLLADIELPHVSNETIQKLAKAGITTVEALSVTPWRQIVDITGMGKETAEKVSRIALNLTTGFKTASEHLKRVTHFMSTGSRKLDLILGGGIETGIITEFVSGYGGGKTQLIYTISALVAVTDKVIVLDTENTYKPERLKQIATARGLDVETVMNNVILAKAYNSDHQRILVNGLTKICSENNVRLVAIDSIIGQYRNEYLGRANLSERQQQLANILGQLLRLAEAFDLAVVYTNQIVSSPDVMYGNPDKPTGGNIVAHAGTQRVQLRRAKENTRVAKIIDSPNLPEAESVFRITEKGIEDVEEKEE